mmetsp:Transcript_28343/g.28638  ORF Transcript_28343/g.28638 Transcript_28343/m.28638 type:complete len:239 (-) Transcript_28343:184-900(-)
MTASKASSTRSPKGFIVHTGSNTPLGHSDISLSTITPVYPFYVTETEASYTWPSSFSFNNGHESLSDLSHDHQIRRTSHYHPFYETETKSSYTWPPQSYYEQNIKVGNFKKKEQTKKRLKFPKALHDRSDVRSISSQSDNSMVNHIEINRAWSLLLHDMERWKNYEKELSKHINMTDFVNIIDKVKYHELHPLIEIIYSEFEELIRSNKYPVDSDIFKYLQSIVNKIEYLKGKNTQIL